ncbi:MAG: DUF4860 domain-containing protein [Brotaphodocola sp.]
MNHNRNHQQIGTLFTLLLFLLFLLCALFTVLTGGKVYENMAERTERQFQGSVALQYIANKVRQGDEAGQISVRNVEGVSVLELVQSIGDNRYMTWIYHQDGNICELFAGEDSGLGLADGIPVMACDGLNLLQEGRLLRVETTGEGGDSLVLAIRSTGGKGE